MTQILKFKIISGKKRYLDIIIILTLLIVALAINLRMIRYGLNGLGDLRWHLTWVQQFSHQLSEGILYPRWLAGTNFGYGSPTFVFYPPFVYYVASWVKLMGFNIEQTMSIVFTLPVFLAGVCFYLYGRNKWGKIASFFGALFYMNTVWIFGNLQGGGLPSLYVVPWLPLGVYLIDRAIAEPKWRIPLAFFWTLVALTHTPSLLISAIAGFFYIVSFFLRRPPQPVIGTMVSMGVGLGMASFYLVPAILEQKFTNLDYAIMFFGDTPGYYIDIKDLLQGKFANLYVQQLIWAAIFVGIALFCWRKEPQKRKEPLFCLIPLAVVFFLRWNGSDFLWQSVSILQKLQRPARLDILIYFVLAALCSMAMNGLLQQRLPLKLFFSTLILTIILFNFQTGYKSSLATPHLHSPGKGKVFVREWIETILYKPYEDKLIDVPEYRPKLPIQGEPPPFQREQYTNSGLPDVSVQPPKPNSPLPVPEIGQPKASVISGKAEVEINNWGSYERQLTVNVQETAQIRLRTYYYPAWQLWVDNQSYPLEKYKDGTLLVKLEPGNHVLRLSYGWTGAFILGSVLSVLSLILCIGYGSFLAKLAQKKELSINSEAS